VRVDLWAATKRDAGVAQSSVRGRDYVRAVVVATVGAEDVAETLDLAWWVFREAAGDALAGWDMAAASAEVQPPDA
jgi:hypothetical protein